MGTLCISTPLLGDQPESANYCHLQSWFPVIQVRNHHNLATQNIPLDLEWSTKPISCGYL